MTSPGIVFTLSSLRFLEVDEWCRGGFGRGGVKRVERGRDYFPSSRCDHLIGNHWMHLLRSCSASVYPVRQVSRIDGQEQEEEEDNQWAASRCPTE